MLPPSVPACAGMTSISLQCCASCGAAQYPPRELCVACLSDALEWQTTEYIIGEVLAVTTLHHSHEATIRAILPLRTGLVRLEAGPTALCFVANDCTPGTRVRVTAQVDSVGRTVLSALAPPDTFAANIKGAS